MLERAVPYHRSSERIAIGVGRKMIVAGGRVNNPPKPPPIVPPPLNLPRALSHPTVW
jgi:hypothetical protein